MNGDRAIVSEQAIIFGQVNLGSRAILEPWTFIGKPLESVIRSKLEERQTPPSLDALYSACPGIVEIGSHAIVRSGAVIYAGTQIGCYVEVGHHAVIREGVHIEDYTVIFPHTSVRKNVTVGKGCRIGGVIGDNSTLDEYVTCLGSLVHDYTISVGGKSEPGPRLSLGSVVGRGSIVVGGVNIGRFAFVAAGAVVRRDVPARMIVAGNPARVVGERSAAEIMRVRDRIKEGKHL